MFDIRVTTSSDAKPALTGATIEGIFSRKGHALASSSEDVVTVLLEKLAALANTGQIDIMESSVAGVLSQGLAMNMGSVSVLQASLLCGKELAKTDESTRKAVEEEYLPMAQKACQSIIEHKECCKSFMLMCEELCVLTNVDVPEGVRKIINDICARYETDESMTAMAKHVNKLLDLDMVSISLQKIYLYLMQRVEDGGENPILRDGIVKRMLILVAEETASISRKILLSVDSEDAIEFKFGMKALSLLIAHGSVDAAIQNRVPELMIGAIKRQQKEELVTEIVNEVIQQVAVLQYAQAILSVPGFPSVISGSFTRMLSTTESVPWLADNIIPRFQLMATLSEVNNRPFSKSPALKALVEAYDTFDNFEYGQPWCVNEGELKGLNNFNPLAIVAPRPKNLSPVPSPRPNESSKVLYSSPRVRALIKEQTQMGAAASKNADESETVSNQDESNRRASCVSNITENSGTPDRTTEKSRERRASVDKGVERSQERRRSLGWGKGSRRICSHADLPHIVRARASSLGTMRKIACSDNMDELLRSCTVRFVALVFEDSCYLELLPDTLFLLGFLSDSSQGYEKIVKLGTVDAILSRVKKMIKTPADDDLSSRIISNCCLTLARLWSGPQDHRFPPKGPKIIVKALKNRAAAMDNRGVNAVCTLIGNVSVHDDDTRRTFGREEACEALVDVLRKLSPDGSDSSADSKSLSAVFRAIGNLALDTDNLGRFHRAKIAEGYAVFLSGVSDLDNDTLGKALQTLSNLALENTESDLVRLQDVIAPLLSLIRKQQTTSVEVYSQTFEILGSLCRWPDNSLYFCHNGGTSTVLTALQHSAPNPRMFSTVVNLLGTLTNEKENLEMLVQTGIYHFIRQILKILEESYCKISDRVSTVWSMIKSAATADGVFDMSQVELRQQMDASVSTTPLPINTLRLARRVMTTKKAATQFVRRGCLKEVIVLLSSRTLHPILYTEIFSLILTVFARLDEDSEDHLPSLFTPRASPRVTPRASLNVQRLPSDTRSMAAEATPRLQFLANPMRSRNVSVTANVYTSKQTKGDTMPAVPDENVMPHWHADRPDGKRIWEIIKLPRKTIRELVEHTKQILSMPDHYKRCRLQRSGIGILCYFACEKVELRYFYTDEYSPSHNTRVPSPVANYPQANSPKNKQDPKAANRFAQPEPSDNAPPDTDISVEAILRRALGNFPTHTPLLTECLYLAANLFYTAVDDTKWVRGLWTPKLVTDINALQRVAQQEEYNDLLASVKSMANMKRKSAKEVMHYKYLTFWSFPLYLTGWAEEKYPNGVQSLPGDIKEKLRMGGTFYLMKADGSKEMKLWKSSHDLQCLCYRSSNEARWSAMLPTGRITRIDTLNESGELRHIQRIDKGPAGQYLALGFSPCRKAPAGTIMLCRFTSSSDRDAFLALIGAWREAATCGFITSG
eukprot:GHVO01021617.1.p1 GENE.GHVO01021617.1~~GHVO01021617.1.p1  ORF type:complete len:1477 (+),score=237.41 GHVO01021617.1:153-4433(+)